MNYERPSRVSYFVRDHPDMGRHAIVKKVEDHYISRQPVWEFIFFIRKSQGLSVPLEKGHEVWHPAVVYICVRIFLVVEFF